MKAKIKELEALLKKAEELAGEIALEASDKAYQAELNYTSLLKAKDVCRDEVKKEFMEYSKFSSLQSSAECLEISVKGLYEYNGLFNKSDR